MTNPYQVSVPDAQPPERPAAVTRGAAAVGVACVGILTETMGAVAVSLWKDPNSNQTLLDEEGFFRPALAGYIGLGLLSVVLLMFGALATLRGANGGRTMVRIVGGINLVTLFGCAGMGGLIEIIAVADPEGMGAAPDHWMFLLGVVGSLLAMAAIIVALIAYGNREATRYLKPMALPPGYPQQYPPQW